MTETEELSGEAKSPRRTVVVGVKLDQSSRELLTWALVKAALPGDLVVALHVLTTNEIVVDRDKNSCMLSTVQPFNSVIAVYEGFCNLKQVDLKLKFCRGSSVRKVLVREAKSYSAAAVIVGTARNNHALFSSVSIAKYCAKKLPQDCSILAVDNGKVMFQREAFMLSSDFRNGASYKKHHSLLGVIQRTLSKSFKERPKETNMVNSHQNSEKCLLNTQQFLAESALIKKCSVCSADYVLENSSFGTMKDSSEDCDECNSVALVEVESTDSPLSSIYIRKFPELRPCWTLLHHNILPDTLEGKGAIVPINAEYFSEPSSPSSRTSLTEALEGIHEKYSATCRLFTYQELLHATSNFKPENLIGKGGSSKVYKGDHFDGKEVAVKILKPSEDILEEFLSEIEILTALHHKNIISLFGYCIEDDNLALVYNYLSQGSIEDILYGNNDSHIFGWSERYNVALGVAEALEYLHSGSSKPVIHRDVKSSNILLSDDFEPQLADFGFAKWASTSSSHITCTDVAGTFGYLAPEYFMYGKVNDKIDVYAFGIVLLELLSGRKPISNEKGQESLVMWAKPILNSGNATELLDASLSENCNDEEMERMSLAATLCIRSAPRARPWMSTVVKLLHGDNEVTEWARLEVKNSEGNNHVFDDDMFSSSNLQSHLNLALLDVDDDSLSLSSFCQGISLEDYLQCRRSRSSSFD